MRRQQHDDDEDERGIIRDGQRVRVPMTMMDADAFDPVQRSVAREGFHITDGSGSTVGLHRPGFRLAATDARKRTTHYDPKGRLKGYSEEIEEDDEEKSGERQASDAAMRARDAAYSAYERDLSAAWRGTASVDAAAKQTVDRQVGQDHQQRMDKVYDSYDEQLREAWRQSK